MKKLIILLIFLIYIPLLHTPQINKIEYGDRPTFQIKNETKKNWFVFRERKKQRYFYRRYA